jgi:hypothetical protein
MLRLPFISPRPRRAPADWIEPPPLVSPCRARMAPRPPRVWISRPAPRPPLALLARLAQPIRPEEV